MVNYQNGKIYQIVCNTTNKVYIGSTAMPLLSQRLAEHKRDFVRFSNGTRKNITSSKVIIEGGNYEIFLIELFPCNLKDELLARERFYIESMECVNKSIPQRTWQERRILNQEKHNEYMKEWRENNQDKMKNSRKIWNELNKEHNKERKRIWNEQNKEKEKIRYKEYYKNNKEAIEKRRRERRAEKKLIEQQQTTA